MNVGERSFFGEFGRLFEEWIVASFFAGTNDWLFSKIPVRNGIFATILSILQLTCTYYATTWAMSFLDSGGSKILFYGDNWFF